LLYIWKFTSYIYNYFKETIFYKNIKGMTKITKDEVRKVAELARLELNEN